MKSLVFMVYVTFPAAVDSPDANGVGESVRVENAVDHDEDVHTIGIKLLTFLVEDGTFI